MRVAALYDVHGNLPALDAVLGDAGEGVDLIVVGGDVAWGPLPRATVERILELGDRALCIRGNADREVAARAGVAAGLDHDSARVNEWCFDRLTKSQREWLGGLRTTAVVDVDGLGPVLFCHGSPRRDDEAITTSTSDSRLRESLAGVRQAVVVCGHTHAQFKREIDGITVVNAGSVGLPFGPRGAYWALLGPAIELRRTDYDYEAAGRRFRAEDGPGAADFAAHVISPPPAETAAEIFTRN